MPTEKITKPEPSAGDTAHTITRAGLSAIPIVGGPAVEIFSTLITPPLAKRRDEWVQSIADGLKALEEKVEGFTIESLQNNEVFVTTGYASVASSDSQSSKRNSNRKITPYTT